MVGTMTCVGAKVEFSVLLNTMPCLSILIRRFPCKILADAVSSTTRFSARALIVVSSVLLYLSFTFNTLDKDPRPDRASRTAVSFESRVHFQLISLSDPEARATSPKVGIHTNFLNNFLLCKR